MKAPQLEEAFAGIYAAHHAEALRVAYLLVGNAAMAEDIVADAFVRVFRAWRRGPITHPRAYLRRTVVNEAHSRFRRLAIERREAARQRGDERGQKPLDEAVAESDSLQWALAQLPPRQRTAVVLRYYADASEAETAAAMGVSTGTVKSATHRGIAALRRLLVEQGVARAAAPRITASQAPDDPVMVRSSLEELEYCTAA